MKHDFSNFTFRCSSLGYIMSDPKGKSNLQKYNEAIESKIKLIEQLSKTSETAVKTTENLLAKIDKIESKIALLKPIKDIPFLSDSCKTHLSDIYTRVVYDRQEDIQSKYMEKGLRREEDAITLYALTTGMMHRKNTERKDNGWINGECDFFTDEKVVDTKVNWSIFQYNRVVSRPIKPLYHWQGDGYMWLWERPKFELAYCLLDTPEDMIKMEEKRLKYNFVGSDEDYEAACKDLRRNHIYGDIPNEDRIRIFKVDFNEERIERIKRRILECREYLNNFNNITSQAEEEEESEAA